MLQFDENTLLGHNIFFLMLFDDIFLLEHFHGIDLLIMGVPNEKDLSIGAFADD